MHCGRGHSRTHLVSHHGRNALNMDDEDVEDISGLFREDGSISMSLSELLQVYHLRIRYTDDEWVYICTDSGRIIQRSTKTPGGNPFDPMRDAGLLEESVMAREVAAYNSVRPANERIKVGWRPYRRVAGMDEGIKEVLPPRIRSGRLVCK